MEYPKDSIYSWWIKVLSLPINIIVHAVLFLDKIDQTLAETWYGDFIQWICQDNP